MVHKITLWLCAAVWGRICLFADIAHVSDMRNLGIYLDKADASTLVLFDVDDVLIVPTQAYCFKHPIRKKYVRILQQKYCPSHVKYLFSYVFKKRTVRLVNKEITFLMEKLKKRRIPTSALTAWWTGPFGTIPHMEEIRLKELKDKGICFKDISPFQKNTQWDSLKTTDGIPMVKDGIIFTALQDKGFILKEVLKVYALKMKKILFIDDSLKQIYAVQKACKDLHLSFTGIHYTESKTIAPHACEEKKEKKRFDVLENHHIWLLDKAMDT
jgi:hypothetical protein